MKGTIPAIVNRIEGSEDTSEALGTISWSFFAKKSSQRRWISEGRMGGGVLPGLRAERQRRSARGTGVREQSAMTRRPRAGYRRTRAGAGRAAVVRGQRAQYSTAGWTSTDTGAPATPRRARRVSGAADH